MAVCIFNSLTKKKEELTPQEDKTLRMYCCGVTVYDQCHIGHARSLYVFDVIRRYLTYRGYDVHFVRNITDVDDKIIAKAQERGRTFEDVVRENIEAYYRDLKDLGIDRADVEPRATENIPGMIEDIRGLIQKGFAYEAGGDVYYDVRKFKEYGRLSGQSIDKMEEAVRIEPDAKKKDPLDFALWKKSKEGEPFWESPWGRGRPGWHIECSCMSLKHLQCKTLDIHAGGRDLIFPHHENEIAQAEPVTGKPFARYWIHHGLLTIQGQKMAKSLGNFITVQEALQKYSADELKMFFLSSHYASPVDFTDGKLLEARKALNRFDILFWKAYQMLAPPTAGLEGRKSVEPIEAEFITQYRREFIEAMDDDFNTPQALGCLFNFINDTNKFIDTAPQDDNYGEIVFRAVDTVESLSRNIFGLFLKEKDSNLTQEQKTLLEERLSARKKKDFRRSDEIRDQLKKRGIIVEDTKDGQKWRFA
ncbi:MAG: cysteine--tRNA ligase [Omnitrophica WOR_2 bacterium RIFCSPLOWO2_12_FULL_50_9]|nr:MAG: cysteine--tRNA ligase [Omnitrophica WOR_2 bacterium RIFCSPHIGHO2_02_FULL_50_17]OGX43313.1 MAG: cysteine--tRNA ligase [Omnitrophica WOR_2 bacterium RIFCSPLOWO2_12_FULL_50_9]